MKILVMTNGTYGSDAWYKERAASYPQVICADGGADAAYRFGITPAAIIGDLDSISAESQAHFESTGVRFVTSPPQKDYTDTQLAYALAIEEGAAEITVWGGTGDRLDHTLSTLFSAVTPFMEGISVRFESPEQTIHLMRDKLRLNGRAGDTVSIIVLSEKATGITIKGFQYPLDQALIESRWQWAVCNVLTGTEAEIVMESGIAAVIHYHKPMR